MSDPRLASADDYRDRARQRLPKVVFDYIDGGAFDEVTMRANRADLQAVCLRQKVMRDMSSINLTTELLGQRMAMPVILGPVGFAGMCARRGEIQAARAAQAANIPFVLSTVGICGIDEVAAAAPAPWLQLYMVRDRDFMRTLLERAWAMGSRVLVFTVDLPVPAPRWRDARSGMASAHGLSGAIAQMVDGVLHPRWLYDVYLRGRPHAFGNLSDLFVGTADFASSWDWIRRNFDPSVNWRDLAFVRQCWPGPIIIKGILDVEDAREAARAGADAIVVSNHGGRQLDGVVSTAARLPRIVEAVEDRLPVLVDGGIRSGLDVLRMLALGARACLLGRAWAYALGAGGEAGVAQMLGQLRSELSAAMVLSGCADVASAGAHLIDDDR